MNNKRYLLLVFIFFAILFMANLPIENTHSTQKRNKVHRVHTSAELQYFGKMLGDTLLPTGFNELFAASGACRKCHGKDSLGIASVDIFGNDINVVDDWRATMMANSAKDPFWRAKVSHEIIVNPEHQEDIENTCLTCHAPMGHFNALHLGTNYPFWLIDIDPIGRDGVSCVICHQQTPDQIGFRHSGDLSLDSTKVAYGPYEEPLISPMFTATGYEPKYAAHTADAGLCAGCHTLITKTIDLQGNLTGNTFVEQATYHEWLNSDYNADNVTCQNCHMPTLEKGEVTIVSGAMVEPRFPFFQHELVGGNVTMLKLLQNNIDELGITAGTAQFDEVIAKTKKMLQVRSIDLQLESLDRTIDTAFFTLRIQNKAGHKLPSGYPSRRAFVEFTVLTEFGDTLFISGKTDDEFEVFGQNADYEPHYQTIYSEEQVQIYELVMGDVNGNVTTVLERADAPIKDNRLPPVGFTTTHEVYDTTLIAGKALTDPDFNFENGAEGSGADIIYYHIPLSGIGEALTVTARVFYQPTPPKWMDEMFAETSPEIEQFRTMFANTDRSPILMQEVSVFVDGISAISEKGQVPFVTISPSLSSDGVIKIESSKQHEVGVFDLEGHLLQTHSNQQGSYILELKNKGVFILKFGAKEGIIQIERVVVN